MRNIISIFTFLVWSIFLAGCSDNDTSPSENTSLTKVSENSLEWGFAYNDAGYPIKVTAPGGKQTAFSYKLDDKQRIRELTKKMADGSKVTYKFDPFGRRISMTDTVGA
ncbi:hypothetical protein THIOM_005048, partial [Candidatus Thiomargarita nelsonii]